jgi:DNA-binding GntR family transcriptional regulator
MISLIEYLAQAKKGEANMRRAEAVEFEAEPLQNLSKEQGVYDQLRRAIINGELKPGQRILPADIGRRLGVSSMPVRNALMRLEAERLVARSPHREFLVTPYSKKEIREVNQVLAVLEGFAARLGSQNMTPERLDALRDIVRRAERHLTEGDRTALMEANRTFHDLLYQQAGNEELQEIMLRLLDRAGRYRAQYYERSQSPSHTVEEHREIVAALERGDHEAVESAVRRYSEETGRMLASLLSGEDR